MNWRSTLVLLAIFLVLLAFAYSQRNVTPFDVAKGPPTGTPAPLADLTLDVVEEVAVVGETGSYTLTKVFGGWNVNGEKAKSDVKDTLEEFVKLNTYGSVPAGADPEDYGFATPAMTVTIRTEDGTSKTVLVGDEVPGEAQFYVRLKDGEGVHMMSNYQLNQLKDWLTDKPIQPTWTPTPTPTGQAETPTPEATASATAQPSEAIPTTARPPTTRPTARPTARPTVRHATARPTAQPAGANRP